MLIEEGSICIDKISSKKLTFTPDDLRGTLVKISSANARVSLDKDNPHSTRLFTTSAGDVAFFATTNATSPLNKVLTIITK